MFIKICDVIVNLDMVKIIKFEVTSEQIVKCYRENIEAFTPYKYQITQEEYDRDLEYAEKRNGLTAFHMLYQRKVDEKKHYHIIVDDNEIVTEDKEMYEKTKNDILSKIGLTNEKGGDKNETMA